MKRSLLIKGKRLWSVCAFLILCIIITCCDVIFDSIDQPATYKVGAVMPIKVKFTITTYGDSQTPYFLIFGFLVPKGWRTAQNATVTYDSPNGKGTMNVIPNNVSPKNAPGQNWPTYLMNTLGRGGNLIDDMEWVVYRTDKTYLRSNGQTFTGDINISLKVGADGNNTLVKLGYCLANNDNELTNGNGQVYYKAQFTPCFELTGGTGDLVDFCNPQFTIANPAKSLDNDIFTLTYDGTVGQTDLGNPDAVYLCATAYTSDGKTINICEQTSKTKLTQTQAGSNKYQMTMWPRAYFGVSDNQTITRMTYFITNSTGAIKIGYGNTAAPFTYAFKCS